MPALVLRAAASWVPLVPLAIANGLLREGLLAPALGMSLALPLSGLLLALLVYAWAWLVAPWLLRDRPGACRVVGIVWLALTFAFEFPFGHYVLGRPWTELAALLDVTTGNLMALVLVATVLAPCLVRRHAGRGHLP